MVVRRLARSAALAAGVAIISALVMALAGRAADAAEI